MGYHGAIKRLQLGSAVIAIAAISLHRLREIIEQKLSPAGSQITKAAHCIKLFEHYRRLLSISLHLGKPLQLDHIAPAEKQQSIARKPIAARPARFLILALNILGQIHMDDKADVRFVYPHTESDRRDHNLCLVL